jgi:hypothetical protein
MAVMHPANAASKEELESQRISRNSGCASQQNPSLALLASWRSATLIRVTHTA